MKLLPANDAATAPSHQPGVDAMVTQLEADLQRLLGSGTRYVLVIGVDKVDALHVQAVTNVSADTALQLLRYAHHTGFETIN